MNSTKSIRRLSEWSVSDVPSDAEVETAHENQHQSSSIEQPAKITERRQSKRLLEREKEMEKENEPPPPKKSRGRPPKKANENQTQSISKTGTDTGNQALHSLSSSSPSRTNQNGTNVYNANNSDNGFEKAKCDLTRLVLNHFEDFKQNPSYKNRYSAKCTHCDGQDDRIKYLKGINTNLKSHLERVAIKYCYLCCFCYPIF